MVDATVRSGIWSVYERDAATHGCRSALGREVGDTGELDTGAEGVLGLRGVVCTLAVVGAGTTLPPKPRNIRCERRVVPGVRVRRGDPAR
eukprot:5899529-Pyramimonas_sp.AAC.1